MHIKYLNLLLTTSRRGLMETFLQSQIKNIFNFIKKKQQIMLIKLIKKKSWSLKNIRHGYK